MCRHQRPRIGAVTGTVNITDGATVGMDNGSFTSPATRTFVVSGISSFIKRGSGTWTMNSPITGTGNVVFGRPESLSGIHLAGANTYQGSTTIQDAWLTVSGGQAIPDTSPVVLLGNFSPELELKADETIASIAAVGGEADITFLPPGGVPAVLTVGGDNTSTRFNGSIHGSTMGRLTKVGTGTLTIGEPSSGFDIRRSQSAVRAGGDARV